MPDIEQIQCICVKGDVPVGNIPAEWTNENYQMALCGELLTIAKTLLKSTQFTTPTIRFFRDSEPVISISREFTLPDVWQGIKTTDVAEVSFDIEKPELYGDILSYNLYIPTSMDEITRTATRSVAGLFYDTAKAAHRKEETMELMLSMIVNILETSDMDPYND